jgi:hypothetical protein
VKAGRIKLTSPEAFMMAFSRIESNKHCDKDNKNNEDEKWSQSNLST